jgi:hypothetical protein
MFRFVAVLLVIAAFGGALYFSGDALEAWESPKPSAEAMPASPAPKKKAAEPKPHAQPTSKPAPKQRAQSASKPPSHPQPATKALARPTWLVELNALCRQGKRQIEEIPQPTGLQDTVRYLRQSARLNSRLNRQGLALVQRSGNAKITSQLSALFDRDEAAMQHLLTLAENGQYQELGRYARSLIPLAKSENGVMAKIGATDCTLSPDDARL